MLTEDVHVCAESIVPLCSLLKEEAGGFGGRRSSLYKSITRGDTHQTMKNTSPLWEETQQKSKQKTKELTTWWILIGFESAAFYKFFSLSMSLTHRYGEGGEEGRPARLLAYVSLQERDTAHVDSRDFHSAFPWQRETLYFLLHKSWSYFTKTKNEMKYFFFKAVFYNLFGLWPLETVLPMHPLDFHILM